MTSNKKRSSLGLALGISLGLASAGTIVNAGSIGDTYTDGDTLTATKMTNIKTAVGDNDTRISGVIANTQAGALKALVDGHTTNITNLGTSITTLGSTDTAIQADVTNLKGNNLGVGAACVGNNASDLMVRVGPICVDKHKVAIYNGTSASATTVTIAGLSCAENGTTNCTMVAQSRSTGTPADGDAITWAQAQRACINAGKRLLTPGEWMAAYTSGLTADIATTDDQDYVDVGALTYGASSAGKLEVGYMGVTTAAGGVNLNSNGFKYDAYAALSGIVQFRCAR